LRRVDELKAAAAGTVTTGSQLSGTWKLLFTTEKVTMASALCSRPVQHVSGAGGGKGVVGERALVKLMLAPSP
jgi:hypothetical protein